MFIARHNDIKLTNTMIITEMDNKLHLLIAYMYSRLRDKTTYYSDNLISDVIIILPGTWLNSYTAPW